MEIHSQKFVKKSDLFKDLDTLRDIFNEADHNTITWGGANRTMIGPSYFLNDFYKENEDIITEEGVEAQWETLKSRLWALKPDGVMVDLEN